MYGVRVENAYLIINRLTGEMPVPLKERIEKLDIPLLGVVLADEQMAEFEFTGRPLVEMGEDSQIYQAVKAMMEQILIITGLL